MGLVGKCVFWGASPRYWHVMEVYPFKKQSRYVGLLSNGIQKVIKLLFVDLGAADAQMVKIIALLDVGTKLVEVNDVIAQIEGVDRIMLNTTLDD